MRAALIFLALVGALAIVLAIIIAAGVLRISALNRQVAVSPQPVVEPAQTSKPAAAAGHGGLSPAVINHARDTAGSQPATRPVMQENASERVAAQLAAAAQPQPKVAVIPPPAPAQKILLEATAARVHGTSLRLEGDKDVHLAFWTDGADYAEWPVHVPQAGAYRVRLTWGSDPNTGGAFQISVGGQTLNGATHSTGSFWHFETMEVGLVSLGAGDAILTVKPNGPFAVALMNLRSIELAPEGAPIARPARKGLIVRKAVYFDPDGGGSIEVTEKVAAMVKDGALTIEVGNDLFGDPAGGKTKRLTVDYSLDGKDQTASADERTVLKIGQ